MPKNFIISGGGTGGHVYPAIAIAQSIKQHDPGHKILFIGSIGRMEMEKVPAYGFDIIGLPIQGLQRKKVWKNIVTLQKMILSIIKTKKIFKNFKPDAVIGVGGYASWAAMQVASMTNIPYFIQEQNSYPGLVNKKMAKKAQAIFVAYPGMEKYFPEQKIVFTGNPVRKDLKNNLLTSESAKKYWSLDEKKFTVLFLGGSLGAKTINESAVKAISTIDGEKVQFICQTGKHYLEEMQSRLKNKTNVIIKDFIREMDYAYAAADIVVSRSGALSISEIAYLQKPAILIPSPNVAEDHQTKNAMALVSKNAAIMLKDSEAVDKITDTLNRLIQDQNLRHQLQENIKTFAKNNAAEEIVDYIMKSIES